MFLNLLLDYLVCLLAIPSLGLSFFLSLQMGIGKEVSSSNVGYAAVCIDICSSWRSFLFIGKKVIWSHPFETLLKSTLGKLWCITPFLRPRSLSELLFTPETIFTVLPFVLRRHLPLWLITVFFVFIPLQWHHYWTKLKRNEKLEKNIKKKRRSDEAHLFE